jgi:UDP-glucose 4-epimerase
MVRKPSVSWPSSNGIESFVFDLAVDDDAVLLSRMKTIDAVVHLAARDSAQCAVDPVSAVAVNIGGTVKICEAARRSNVQHLIYLSTIHVYGASLSGVVTENTVPRPRHPYAISHRAAEDFVLAGSGYFSPVVLRLSNVCGFPLSPELGAWKLLINDLCRQAVVDRKLKLHSPGYQRRDFVAVSDAVRGIQHAMELSIDEAADRVFNLGGGMVYSVREAAELVASRCQVVLGFLPLVAFPEGDDAEKRSLISYSSDAFERTGYRRQSSLSAAIDDCLARTAAQYSAVSHLNAAR